MSITVVIIATLLGMFFNCYRGGLIKNRGRLISRLNAKWLRKTVNFLAQGDIVNMTAFAVFIVITHGWGPALFLYAAVMMLRGATPGWGRYIGAACGWETEALEEVHYIDKLIERYKDRPRLWGVLGLSLRCGEWGLFIGAPLLSFWPVLAGLLAGPIAYLVSRSVPRVHTWKAFEAILGGLFWAACVL